ncbi:MAG: prolyl oligopeptidase family serine peptidase [Lewinellaceae bacterium]|nr:prolyl oligopeptidase family serine peptidase [Lewinellaceae bacterium]
MLFRKWLIFSLILIPGAFRAQQLHALAGGADKPAFSLDEVQKRHFLYFWELAHSENFQIPDRYPTDHFSSIAATGFGLSAYLVGVERGWVSREQAAQRVLKTLEVLKALPQGPQMTGVAGYRGWYYHFLNTQDALRFKNVELSSIDTGLLMAGILSCMTYFDRDNATEKAIRDLSDFLFRRVEFDWYLNEHDRLSMGWFPDRGFLPAEWHGYNEAMILNIMALGSPTHPVPAKTWDAWCATYYRTDFKGHDMVNFGPLFGHQYSHVWIDFRDIRDPYMQKMGIDYFENSRRAALANRRYCIDNPLKFKGYGEQIWGLTACDGPGYANKMYEGREQVFQGYSARGVAADYHTDDGTIAPTAAVASMPFAPEYCLPATQAMWERWPVGPYGFFDAYNESFTWTDQSESAQPGRDFWVDKDYLGIDQGPIVLMIENYRSGFLWSLMKKNPYIVRGLQRAGFTGGWLDRVDSKITARIDWADGEKAMPNPDVPLDRSSFFSRAVYKDKAGNKLPYQLMEPWKAKTSEKYPLVLFLHGSGERGDDNSSQMRNGVYGFCERKMLEEHPCYLLVPQCPEGLRWGGSSKDWSALYSPDPTVPGRMTLELLEKILEEHPQIDRNRIYITGLSMGGFGTFDLLARRPELFAAGMPLCGGGDPDVADRMKNIPIWVFHGRLDDAVYPQFSRRSVDALKKAGNERVKYTEYSTLGHNVWDVTYYNPEVLEWLFAQRKGQ